MLLSMVTFLRLTSQPGLDPSRQSKRQYRVLSESIRQVDRSSLHFASVKLFVYFLVVESSVGVSRVFTPV